MQPNVDLNALTDIVLETLLRCRKLGLANMQVDPEDPEVIEGYVIVIAANGIDADMVKAALPKIYAEEFYPKAGTIVTLCEPFRVKVINARKRAYLASLIECEDSEGNKVLAEPCRVQCGRLLPGCLVTGDGSSAPALPAPSVEKQRQRIAALVSGTALPLAPALPAVRPIILAPEKRVPTSEELAEVDRVREKWKAQATVSRILNERSGESTNREGLR